MNQENQFTMKQTKKNLFKLINISCFLFSVIIIFSIIFSDWLRSHELLFTGTTVAVSSLTFLFSLPKDETNE